MPERACKQCGGTIVKKPGPGRWPHTCRPCRDAERARIETARQQRAERAAMPKRMLTPAERSAKAAAASRIRWAAVSPEARSEQGRRAAAALWDRRLSDEQREAVAARKAELQARREKPCPYCGEPVGNARRVKCNKSECHLAHKAATMAARRAADPNYGRTGYNEAAAARHHRRRALKKGATVERFSPSEIYERDGWVCGICSDRVDPSLKWPDPMSVSLDHKTPLALGGDHSRANTQCSHLTCNVRKGAQAA